MPHPSHCSWFDHPNNIGWAVQLIMLHEICIRNCNPKKWRKEFAFERYIGLHCGILLKTYLEIGGYKMCAVSGSKWVPITVLDLRVPKKGKNYLTSRTDFIVSLRTPLCAGCRLVKLWCVSAATWLLQSRGFRVVVLRGKKPLSGPNTA